MRHDGSSDGGLLAVRDRVYQVHVNLEALGSMRSALGLILNCIVLWNTRYMNAALEKLRAQGYPVLDEGGFRELRDPDAEDDEIPD